MVNAPPAEVLVVGALDDATVEVVVDAVVDVVVDAAADDAVAEEPLLEELLQAAIMTAVSPRAATPMTRRRGLRVSMSCCLRARRAQDAR
jgi:hypothetical protein